VKIIAALVLVLVATGGWAALQLDVLSGFSQPVYLDFERGTSTRSMANELARNRVVEAPWEFFWPVPCGAVSTAGR